MQTMRTQAKCLIKRVGPHPSRVPIGGGDNQKVLVGILSVQRLSQKQQANPAERVQRTQLYCYYIVTTGAINASISQIETQ